MNKKYSVSVPMNASCIRIVEASSKEEALEKAIEKGSPVICHQCAGKLLVEDINEEAVSLECVEEI